MKRATMNNEEFFQNAINASRKAWMNALGRGIDPVKAFDTITAEFISKKGMPLEMAKTLTTTGLLFAAMQCAKNDTDSSTAAARLLHIANQVGGTDFKLP